MNASPGSSLAIRNRGAQVFSFVDLPGAKPKVNETKACWDLGLSKEPNFEYKIYRDLLVRFPLTVTWIEWSVDHPWYIGPEADQLCISEVLSEHLCGRFAYKVRNGSQ